ncbi:hypothetical protein [Chitinophaga barathri]|uniref:Uncharacterized protein n=1 Tax=Chitinophaga barathri TaxID=1647451 RepID=A0A3N4MGS2_9BACT|nr:hypothetical protein [Chitinophaga barathri]RPD42788.1 hypothetical protein EG028_00370 [Chitinophaga barathri]
MSNDLTTGLTVPVDIAALCVGIKDEQDKLHGTSTFAGATTFFTDQTGDNQAFLGSNVALSFQQAPWQQLQTGIHVHWALPQALTHGQHTEEGDLEFSAAPNRWLVSRIITDGATLTRTSWVVESDFLYEKLPARQLAITLPVITATEAEQNYRYSGRNVPFDAQWKEPDNAPDFVGLTGGELTAVSNGEPSFAAYYPDSNSVFGFYDNMSGVKVPDGGTVNIMYQVTGWYTNPVNDPLNGGKTAAQIQELYDWTFTSDVADQQAHWSLYSGLIQNITWSPDKDYIVGQALQEPIKAVVTVGNTPPQTFSAYFKDQYYKDQPFFEQLFDAFQMGLLEDFRQPTPDQMALLEEALHQDEFANQQSGIIYLIVVKNDRNEEIPVENLPVALGDALNLLNFYRQQLDEYRFFVSSFQWELFSDWYRLMKTTDTDTRNTLYRQLRQMVTTEWKTIQQQYETYEALEANQKTSVTTQINALDAAYLLKTTEAPRYWQPSEPVVLITTEHQPRQSVRYGNVIYSAENGYLQCRLSNQLLSAIKVNKTDIPASGFSSISFPTPNHLPQPDTINNLLLESVLLNTSVVANLSGLPEPQLQAALKTALEGGAQTDYTFTGLPPAEVAVHWWNGNNWSPVFLEWSAFFYPLHTTEQDGKLQDYKPGFFTDHYTIGTSEGGLVSYTGTLDPATIDFDVAPKYVGGAIMGTSAAQSLVKQLGEYLADHTDEELQKILDALGQNLFFSQSLNGFTSQLTMQEQQVQLNIKAAETNPYVVLTAAVADIAGDFEKVSPLPNGHYNPVRAGFMKLKFKAIDVYGQKREVKIEELRTAASMSTWFDKKPVKDIVYMPARLAQPSRLLFRWLASLGSDFIQEMDALPSVTPVIGWLMPNHLDGSLFFYDQEGRPLGNLGLNGNNTAIVWQSAPGNDATIDEDVTQVFNLQPAPYKDMAIALSTASVDFFTGFYKAIDEMHNFINPQSYAQNTDLAVLIGRPVAVAQVMLQLELCGGPVYNQSYIAVNKQEFEYDNNFTGVDFPVILGDLEKINDGLIGYFKQESSVYDYASFFTQGTDNTSGTGVTKPDEKTLRLTARRGSSVTESKRVLLLLDPRAAVHATMGILPTKAIDIPASMYLDTLSILEMTFLVAPVFRGASGFQLPLPKEEGYQWSWIEEEMIPGGNTWVTDPEIATTTGQAVAAYTPQRITEGWLRLNPMLLQFKLLNNLGQPVVKTSSTVDLDLHVTNKKPSKLQFKPGQLIGEEQPNTGSMIYIHFGDLVSQADVENVQIDAPGWSFKNLQNPYYGSYWGGTPGAAVILEAGQSLAFHLRNVKTTAQVGQVQVFFDYYNITGINDGTDASIINTEK